jgi:hypothetical protein
VLLCCLQLNLACPQTGSQKKLVSLGELMGMMAADRLLACVGQVWALCPHVVTHWPPLSLSTAGN